MSKQSRFLPLMRNKRRIQAELLEAAHCLVRELRGQQPPLRPVLLQMMKNMSPSVPDEGIEELVRSYERSLYRSNWEYDEFLKRHIELIIVKCESRELGIDI